MSNSASISAHPLRQTSFPPEESALNDNARSPSVESDFTGVTGAQSVITSGTGTGKRRRGRRRKTEGSVKSGGPKATGTVDGASATGQLGDEGAEEEEEEGEGDEGMVDEGAKVDLSAEKKNLAYVGYGKT